MYYCGTLDINISAFIDPMISVYCLLFNNDISIFSQKCDCAIEQNKKYNQFGKDYISLSLILF